MFKTHWLGGKQERMGFKPRHVFLRSDLESSSNAREREVAALARRASANGHVCFLHWMERHGKVYRCYATTRFADGKAAAGGAFKPLLGRHSTWPLTGVVFGQVVDGHGTYVSLA